jgi:hypothetical protein
MLLAWSQSVLMLRDKCYGRHRTTPAPSSPNRRATYLGSKKKAQSEPPRTLIIKDNEGFEESRTFLLPTRLPSLQPSSPPLRAANADGLKRPKMAHNGVKSVRWADDVELRELREFLRISTAPVTAEKNADADTGRTMPIGTPEPSTTIGRRQYIRRQPLAPMHLTPPRTPTLISPRSASAQRIFPMSPYDS